jgi:hypothetical protein
VSCAIGGVFATSKSSQAPEAVAATAPLASSQAVAMPGTDTSAPAASTVFQGRARASEEAAPTF